VDAHVAVAVVAASNEHVLLISGCAQQQVGADSVCGTQEIGGVQGDGDGNELTAGFHVKGFGLTHK